MKVVGVLQARMGSSRLPGKILAPLAGIPMLSVIRARTLSVALDGWWIATTEEAADDLTAMWGEALGFNVFRGATEDVLSRFVRIVEETRADWVVRLTADNPFVDAGVIRLAVDAARSGARADLITFAGHSLPLGYAVSAVRGRALLDARSEIPLAGDYHRSHVTSWTAAHGAVVEVPTPEHWPERPRLRWTVDTIDDYRMASALMALLGDTWRSADYDDLVRVLDVNPEVASLNQHVIQKPISEG